MKATHISSLGYLCYYSSILVFAAMATNFSDLVFLADFLNIPGSYQQAIAMFRFSVLVCSALQLSKKKIVLHAEGKSFLAIKLFYLPFYEFMTSFSAAIVFFFNP